MRSKLLGKEIIAQGQKGTLRWAVEAHGSALGLFKAKERNDLVREALVDGGHFYIAVFVPMNFSEYAKRKGWHVNKKYSRRKERLIVRGVLEGPASPLVFTGVTREAAVTRSTVTATATANKATIYLRIPIPPHGTGKSFGIAPIVGQVLKSIMPWEVTRVAEEVEDSLQRGLQGALEKRYANQTPPAPRRMPAQGPMRARAHAGPARAITVGNGPVSNG